MDATSSLPDIRKTRILDEPIQQVWETIASPEGIALWFVPNDFQPVRGHEFHVQMDEPQGRTACKVTSIDRPAHLAYDVGPDWKWEFELKELDGKTELTFTWSGWDRDKKSVFGAPHAALHEHLTDGMNVLVKRLARSVRNVRPPEQPLPVMGENRMKQATIQISGMSCGHCIEKIERVLERFGASGQVGMGSATFQYDESRLSPAEVKEAIEDLGYDVD